MKDDRKLRPWELAALLALCATLLTGARHGGAETAGWWCVIFPPLTPRAAEVMATDAQTPPGEYEIRFRILELWDAIAPGKRADPVPLGADADRRSAPKERINEKRQA